MDVSQITDGALGYIFACLFLFLSLVFYTLFSSNCTAWVLTKIVSRFLLPKGEILRIGSLSFAPLRCRVFVKDLYYFNANTGVRITDAYFTFKFWGRLFREEEWRTPSEKENIRKGHKVRCKHPGTNRIEKDAVVAEDSHPGETLNVQFQDGTYTVHPRKNVSVEVFTGRLQIHINGIELTLYNSVSRYEAMKKMQQGDIPAAVEQVLATDFTRKPSSFEKIMKFMKRIEIDMRAVSIAMGSLNMPYYMHFSCSHCLGSYFVEPDYQPEDLNRQVVDLAFRRVGLQWVPLQEELKEGNQSEPTQRTGRTALKRLKTAFMENAHLMMQGDTQAHTLSPAEGGVGVNPFYTVLDKSEEPEVHVVYYWDTPGLETEDDVVRDPDTLPKSGIEVEIDARRMYYGPFANLCRQAITSHFFPWDYQPWPLYTAKRGAARPVGLWEMRIDFVRDTVLVFPFKHKTLSPQLPYDIKDSGNTGRLTISLGKGSHYVYRYPWIMHEKDKHIICETYIAFEQPKIFTSLNNSTFISADRFEVFMDALYHQQPAQKQDWDIIVRFTKADIYYSSDHLNYLFDVIADWGYAKCTYHDEPIEQYWAKSYHFSEFVPYTCLYEVFFDGGCKFHLNANQHNIVYATDHTNPASNTFVELAMQTGYIYFLCPYDGYCIFRENEYKYQYDIKFTDVTMSLHLPTGHTAPKDTGPFFVCDVMNMGGYYSSVYPNCSLPMAMQEKELHQTNTTPGLAINTNTCLLVVEINGVRLNVRSHHLTAIGSVYGNFFSEEASTVTPDEYARFQSSTGKNIKYQMFYYLTRNDYRFNDLDMTVEVTVNGLQMDLNLGHDVQNGISAVARIMTTSYNMHFNSTISEQTVSLSPLIVTVHKKDVVSLDSVVVQGFEMWKLGFYGPAPLYLLYHDNVRLNVGKVTCTLDMNSCAFFAEFGKVFLQSSVDTQLLEIIQSHPALRREELLAQDRLTERPVSVGFRKTTDTSANNKDIAMSIVPQDPFRDVTIICAFLEWYGKRADAVEEASRLAYHLQQISVKDVDVHFHCDNGSRMVLLAEQGVHFGGSTLHDMNTDSRWTAHAPNVTFKSLVPRTPDMDESVGDFVEVTSMTSGFFVRKATCFGAGESYVTDQYAKQRAFLSTNRILVEQDGIQEAIAERSKRKRGEMDPAITMSNSSVDLKDVLLHDRDDATSFASCNNSDNGGGDFEDDVIRSTETTSQEGSVRDLDSTAQLTSPARSASEDRPKLMFDAVRSSGVLRSMGEYHAYLRSYEMVTEVMPVNCVGYSRAATHSTRKLGSLSGVPKITLTRSMSTSKTFNVIHSGNANAKCQGEININDMVVDNERRSRDKTSTYHWHVEIPTALHFLITPKSLKCFMHFYLCFQRGRKELNRMLSPKLPGLPRPTTTASNPDSQVKQKMEWLYNYTSIFSFATPRVQVDFLTSLKPLSRQTVSKPNVVQASVLFSNVNAVISREEPARVQGNRKAKQLSASIAIENLSVVLQCLSSRGSCLYDLPRSVLDNLPGVLLPSVSCVFIMGLHSVKLRAKHYKDVSDSHVADKLPVSLQMRQLYSFLNRDAPEFVYSIVDVIKALQTMGRDFFTTSSLVEQEACMDHCASPTMSPRSVPRSRSPFQRQTTQPPMPAPPPPRPQGTPATPTTPATTSLFEGLEFTFSLNEIQMKYYSNSLLDETIRTAAGSAHPSSVISVKNIVVNGSTRKNTLGLFVVVDITQIYARVFPTILEAFSYPRPSSDQYTTSSHTTETNPATPSVPELGTYIQLVVRECDINFAVTAHNYVSVQVNRLVAAQVLQGTSPASAAGSFTRQRTTALDEFENADKSELIVNVDYVAVKYNANLGFYADAGMEVVDNCVLQITIKNIVSAINADSGLKNRGSLHFSWGSFLLDMPHRLNASETVVPQCRELIGAWKNAVNAQSENAEVVWQDPNSTTYTSPSNGSSFGNISVDLNKVEVRVTLIQNTTMDFMIPRITFSQIGTDGVTSRIKFHLIGPQLTSVGRIIPFPDVYLFMTEFITARHKTCYVIVEKLDVEINSEMFVNSVAMYRKLGYELVEYVTGVKSEDVAEPTSPVRVVESSPSSFDVTVYFAGANVVFNSHQSDLKIEVINLKTSVSSHSARAQQVKWFVSVPRIEVSLLDVIDKSSLQASRSYTQTTTLADSTPSDKKRRGSYVPPPPEEEVEPDHATVSFLWLNIASQLHISNFNEQTGGGGSGDATPFGAGDVHSDSGVGDANNAYCSPLEPIPDTPSTGSFGQQRRTTHVQSVIPSLKILLRSGAVEMLLRLVDEYKAEWSLLEGEVVRQTEEMRVKLKNSSFFNHVVRNKFSKLRNVTSVSTSISEDESARWMYVNSVFINGFSLVIPCGDNLYHRAVTKQLPYLSCTHEGHHTLACIDKKQLIPSFAWKISIDEIYFARSAQQLVNADNENCETQIIQVSVDNFVAYAHEGQKADGKTQFLSAVQQQRKAAGGLGWFNDASPQEITRSRNTIALPQVSARAKIQAGCVTHNTHAHIHMEGPQIRINPRVALYVSDFVREFTPIESNRPSNSPPSTPPASPTSKSTIVRISLDLAQGEISCHSWGSLPAGFTLGKESVNPSMQRRVSFSQLGPSSQKTPKRASGPGESGANTGLLGRTSQDTTFVASIPTPATTVFVNTTSTGGVALSNIHVDVSLAPIDIHPTTTLIWQEYVFMSNSWSNEKVERANTLCQSLKLNTTDDIPLPKTFLSNALEWRKSTPPTHSRQTSATFGPDPKFPGGYQSQSVLHINIAPFRISATCLPVSMTYATLLVEDQGVINIMSTTKSLGKISSTSTAIAAKKLKLEVQTRMEVKFLEFTIPELWVDMTQSSECNNYCISISEGKKEQCEFIMRMTHASQWLMMAELWKQKVAEARVQVSQYVISPAESPAVKATTDATMYIVDLEKLVVKIELGTSNKYEATLLKSCVLYGVTPKGCIVERKRGGKSVLAENALTIADMRFSDITIRCDGLASGTIGFNQGIALRWTVKGPGDESDFTTQQFYVGIPHFRASIRERHVKEIFNAEIGALLLRVFDENLAGTIPQHHVFLDTSTEKTSISMSTEFLTVVSNILLESQITIEQEKSTAQSKLDGHRFYSGGKPRKVDPHLGPLSPTQLLVVIPFAGSELEVAPTGQVRILFRDIAITLGDLSHVTDAAALQLNINSVCVEYAQCLDKLVIKKVLQLTISAWEILRRSSEKRSAILGSHGTNTFDLNTSQPLGNREVTYGFGFTCDKPWHGSPHMVDFDVINKTIRSFSSPVAATSATTPQPQQQQQQPQGGDRATPTPSMSVLDERVFKAKKVTRFAPELRVVSDAVINIDTVLGWLGMKENAIPRLLYINVADNMEAVLHTLYTGTCPQQILEYEKSIVLGVASERTPSMSGQSGTVSPPVTPSTTPGKRHPLADSF